MTVCLVWVSPSGETMRSEKPWKRGANERELTVWMLDYMDRLAKGYKPEGFDEPPLPHCAQLVVKNNVVAEWNRPLTLKEINRIDGWKAG